MGVFHQVDSPTFFLFLLLNGISMQCISDLLKAVFRIYIAFKVMLLKFFSQVVVAEKELWSAVLTAEVVVCRSESIKQDLEWFSRSSLYAQSAKDKGKGLIQKTGARVVTGEKLSERKRFLKFTLTKVGGFEKYSYRNGAEV